MCDCKALQSRLDLVVNELEAEREDNLFLRKRRIELYKENYQIEDLKAEIEALKEQVNELKYQRDQLRKEHHARDIEAQFPEGFFPPVV